MSERFYPIFLIATRPSGIRSRLIGNQEAYDAFVKEFEGPGVEFREMQTLEAWYIQKMSKFIPDIKGWSDKNVDPEYWIQLIGPD
jgi:hypothetical protein